MYLVFFIFLFFLTSVPNFIKHTLRDIAPLCYYTHHLICLTLVNLHFWKYSQPILTLSSVFCCFYSLKLVH